MNKLLLATAIAGASAITITPEHMQAFTDFTTKYEKTYADDAERANRLGVFTENFEKVTMQNRDHLLLGGEAVFGITKFMDLTPAEFKSTYLTYIPRDESTVKRTDVVTDGDGELAGSVDWRTKGAVTPVKDQGQCGSCWAFSATEAIESYAFLAGHGLQELSAQQINSCDTVDLGCNGGNSETAYEYVVKNGGISTEEAYPYTSGDGKTGRCKSETSAIKIKGYTSVKKGEKNLKTALNHGPVSICVAADSFQSYSGGILKSCPGRIDHCVQAVGYSTEGNYWIVRNSWNTNWGEDGFIRVEMGDNLCHIADDVTFPTF